MNKKIFEILVCPICKGKLDYLQDKQELLCKVDGLAFPIKNGMPVMLEAKARQVSLDEIESNK